MSPDTMGEGGSILPTGTEGPASCTFSLCLLNGPHVGRALGGLERPVMSKFLCFLLSKVQTQREG